MIVSLISLILVGCAHAHDPAPAAEDAVRQNVGAATTQVEAARQLWLRDTTSVVLISSRDVAESRRAYDVLNGALVGYETAAYGVVNSAMGLPIETGSTQSADAHAWLSTKTPALKACVDGVTTIPSFDYFVDEYGYAYLTNATVVSSAATNPVATYNAQVCLFKGLLHGGLAPYEIRGNRYAGPSL